MLARRTKCLHAPSRNDGFIIVAVLWILAALATLASIIAVYVINAANAFAVHDERLQAEALTRAAIELTVYQLASDTPPTRGSFAVRMGNASIAAEFNSEMARIDLNAAPKEVLSNLFAEFGAPRAAADGYADRIIGWRGPPAPDAPDESSYYRAAGLAYAPRGAPFQHVAELGLVLGIPEIMIERATPFLTVYSGQAQINIMDAAPQVIAALPGMDPGRLGDILAQRAGGQTPQAMLALLGPAQPLGSLSGSKALRVTARIAFDSGQRVTSEAVIFILDNGSDVYRVLTWRDDVDDAPAEQPKWIVKR
jgi:general secretion pathway protein K